MRVSGDPVKEEAGRQYASLGTVPLSLWEHFHLMGDDVSSSQMPPGGSVLLRWIHVRMLS